MSEDKTTADSIRREHPINLPWTLKGSCMSQEITGAEILVRCLAEEGVEHVFGYPGGAVLYIYDEIFKQKKTMQRMSSQSTATVRDIELGPYIPSDNHSGNKDGPRVRMGMGGAGFPRMPPGIEIPGEVGCSQQ